MVFEAIPKEIFFYSKIINQWPNILKNITPRELETLVITCVLTELLIVVIGLIFERIMI